MRMRTIGTALLLAMALSGIPAFSVAQTAQKPSFEVASIKQAVFPNDAFFAGYSSVGPCAAGRLLISGNQVTLGQISLCGLIGMAYDLRDYMIVGGPDWFRKADRSLYYEIQAIAPATSTPLTLQLAHEMLQTLLADRFQLKVQKEMKELPVYTLVVGKNGPKLSLDKDGPCEEGARNGLAGVFIAGPGLFASCRPAATMTQLADRLSRYAGRPVLDKTGIDGGHTLELKWDTGGPGNESDAPSLSKAIQEQLGLKLEPTKAQVEILVIDSVQRPTEN